MKSLNIFLKEYEVATNSHDFSLCAPLIDNHAIYWFTDGTFEGIDQIKSAFEKTWEAIQDEVYEIKNVKWLHKGDNAGTCIYDFYWKGIVDGEEKSGNGKGTNVIIMKDNCWKMIHEHLSKPL